MIKVLIMGLPGSGKTTLAEQLAPMLDAKWVNADHVREDINDWDFSEQGRIKQAHRMANVSNKLLLQNNVVADFICPTHETRKIFDADYTVWMNTVDRCEFEDTNEMFVKPETYNFEVISFDTSAKKNAQKIFNVINFIRKHSV